MNARVQLLLYYAYSCVLFFSTAAVFLRMLLRGADEEGCSVVAMVATLGGGVSSTAIGERLAERMTVSIWSLRLATCRCSMSKEMPSARVTRIRGRC